MEIFPTLTAAFSIEKYILVLFKENSANKGLVSSGAY